MDEYDGQDDRPMARSGRPVQHRPWSTLLLVAHTCATVAGAVVLGFGVLVLALSSGASASDSENWGGIIGMILTVVGLVVGIPGAVLTKLTVSGRREAERGRPGTLRTVATAAIVIAALCAFLMSTGGLTSAFAVGLVFCALYALPAVFVLQVTHAGSEPPPDDGDHPGVTTA